MVDPRPQNTHIGNPRPQNILVGNSGPQNTSMGGSGGENAPMDNLRPNTPLGQEKLLNPEIFENIPNRKSQREPLKAKNAQTLKNRSDFRACTFIRNPELIVKLFEAGAGFENCKFVR